MSLPECRWNENGNFHADRLQPDEEWMDTREAAAMLFVAPDSLSSTFRPDREQLGVRRISRSKKGSGPRAVGYLYYRKDIEALARISRHAQLTPTQALRVLIALKEEKICAINPFDD